VESTNSWEATSLHWLGELCRAAPLNYPARYLGFSQSNRQEPGGGLRLGGICGFERVDPFAFFLRYIGPSVIVTAEHGKLHFVGYALFWV
jgi:hypothetical protein